MKTEASLLDFIQRRTLLLHEHAQEIWTFKDSLTKSLLEGDWITEEKQRKADELRKLIKEREIPLVTFLKEECYTFLDRFSYFQNNIRIAGLFRVLHHTHSYLGQYRALLEGESRLLTYKLTPKLIHQNYQKLINQEEILRKNLFLSLDHYLAPVDALKVQSLAGQNALQLGKSIVLITSLFLMCTALFSASAQQAQTQPTIAASSKEIPLRNYYAYFTSPTLIAKYGSPMVPALALVQEGTNTNVKVVISNAVQSLSLSAAVPFTVCQANDLVKVDDLQLRLLPSLDRSALSNLNVQKGEIYQVVARSYLSTNLQWAIINRDGKNYFMAERYKGKMLVETFDSSAYTDPKLSRLVEDDAFLFSTNITSQRIQRFLENYSSVLSTNATSYNGTNMPISQAIYSICKDTKINPLVILTKLQVEQSLITSTSATGKQLDWALGYGATDSRRTSYYKGFGNQIFHAAHRLRDLYDEGRNFHYPLLFTGLNYGGKHGGQDRIIVLNASTRALYIYTPHTGDFKRGGTSGGNILFFQIFARFSSEL